MAMEEMRKDAHLLSDLAPIRLAMGRLQKQIRDTSAQAGSEAYAAARIVYTVVKNFGGGSLEMATGDLGQRFTRRYKVKPTADGATAAAGAPAAASAPAPTTTTPAAVS